MKKNENKKCTIQDMPVPGLHQVVIHNDDFTPREWVVGMLEKLFYLSRQKATEIMLEAHMQGNAVCGMFSKDFAEAKVAQIREYARQKEVPLHCSMEAA